MEHEAANLFLCLTVDHAMKTWQNGGITPCILNISIRWRWVVSFTHQLLYSWGKRPH